MNRTIGGHRSMSRSQRITPRVLCTRHVGGDSTSRRVWCSHARLAPVHGNEVRTRDRPSTAPEPLQRKNEKRPLSGAVCLLTQGGLIRVRRGHGWGPSVIQFYRGGISANLLY